RRARGRPARGAPDLPAVRAPAQEPAALPAVGLARPHRPAAVRSRGRDHLAARVVPRVDADPRSAAGGPADVQRAVGRAGARAVTDRAAFLQRIRSEMARAGAGAAAAAHGPGVTGTAPRPERPREMVEILRRELAERWRETLERFRVEFERVA